MKYYIVEPTYKKSFVEYTAFKRVTEDGERLHLTKELGWRWGSFLFSVPETEEEAMAFIKDQGYDDVLQYAEDYGCTETDAEGNEVLDPNTTLLEMISSQTLPLETDTFVDITEDFPNAEFIDAWDGCWEDWNIVSYPEIEAEEKEALIEEAEAAYAEEYEEAVEELGWEFVDTYFEMHCSPKITECDATGKPLDAPAD